MSAALLLTRLAVATLVFTVVSGLLMLARRRLRTRLGAEAVYGLWLAVPLGVALCCWPVHRVLVPLRLPPAAPAPAAPATAALPPAASVLPHAATLLLGAWLLGAAAAALLLVLRQRRCQRALGPLRCAGEDTWLSARSDLGPMLVGLPRPRIVLPADFAERYTPDEQAAILAHERTHRRRGDLWWNALAALLRCVFWFHPLAFVAQRRYLADQELACDSAVLRASRLSPRTYAQALLKTQTGAGLPLACTMQAGAALKERILNLQQGAAPRRMRVAALLMLALLGAAGGRIAWAASRQVVEVGAAAPDAVALKASIDLSVDGAAPRHEERSARGALHLGGLRDAEGRACEAELMPRLARGDVVDLRMRLVCDGQPAGYPRLLARLGEPATIAIGRTERQADGSYVTTHGFKLTVRFDKP
jgi:beta-lactamase regulating signal transducer with metallopeptidase domain